MDSMNDLERELAAAMQVEPSTDFAARVRGRIASEAPSPRWHVPRLALIGGVFGLAALAVSILPLRQASIATGHSSVLPSRLVAVLVPLPPASPSFASRVVNRPQTRTTPRVLVSQSEMLALRRLFSGVVAAPAATAIADELAIPTLTVDALELPALPEGDRK